ncbi:hypothetical protein SAMN02745216_03370 [Desulfatibacillum alkenivorans DSM 16219]|uniref:Uncharacterized protein n=1 Tax=Desulfatibacillum alkenivorans DSM 16219 TaxID=1121393 RepID=A0A1M6S2F4_9BACT|nr:hypothetical protein [Desulfatibacillum alkenivorans]SHK38809.1 hypothetical protein SAMN02745216_03370 [Desulfatibacillum alkenivorans DSM 16219]
MQTVGAADIVFILCIVAGLIGLYINRPAKRAWNDDVLNQIYGEGKIEVFTDAPLPK